MVDYFVVFPHHTHQCRRALFAVGVNPSTRIGVWLEPDDDRLGGQYESLALRLRRAAERLFD